MQTAPLPQAATPIARSTHAAHAVRHRSAFRQLLSELNPLQYLPVVGTIYRAITGDTIPESARLAGSLVVSGLTGGPVGIALNLGTTALQHLLGIDPERIGTHLLADIGIGHHAAPPEAAPASPPSPGQAATPANAWSAAQLAAYGIQQDRSGGLTRGDVSGADVLNTLELARIAGRPSAFSAMFA